MDKKKVKIHVEDAIAFLDKLSNYVNGYNNNVYLCNAIKALDMAKAELSKSDWVSVEDRLPEFGERVCVRMVDINDFITYSISRRKDDGESLYTKDYHKFIIPNMGYKVTHWKPIEKLEEQV